MTNFHKVKIKDIYKETEDCSVITLDIPEALKASFQYKQGQHLTLRAMINGEDVRRPYSLCSSPIDNKWQIAVKKIAGGRFSTFANEELKNNDTLDVMFPDGKFYIDTDAAAKKNYIAFAAGSGVTPIFSIIKTHLAVESKSTFKLFFLNRKTETIIFKDELDQLVKEFEGRFEVFYFLTQETSDNSLLNGRFTEEKLQELAEKVVDVPVVADCFVCGPEEMIFLIKDEMMKAGMAEEKIHFELFNSGHTKEDKKHIAEVLEHRIERSEVTIHVDGDEFTFDMVGSESNILDSAMDHDADVPFACKGGVCCTCKAKVLEGTVEMKLNYALDEEDLANNLVLTCQAIPTSEKVVLDYDI